jgi:hypothetical protein
MLPIRGHKYVLYVLRGFTLSGVLLASPGLELLLLGWPFHSSVTMMGLALDAICVSCCLMDIYAKFKVC